MYRENKIKFLDFVNYDQFELNAYLSYLFHRFYEHTSNRSEEKKITVGKDLGVPLLK